MYYLFTACLGYSALHWAIQGNVWHKSTHIHDAWDQSAVGWNRNEKIQYNMDQIPEPAAKHYLKGAQKTVSEFPLLVSISYQFAIRSLYQIVLLLFLTTLNTHWIWAPGLWVNLWPVFCGILSEVASVFTSSGPDLALMWSGPGYGWNVFLVKARWSIFTWWSLFNVCFPVAEGSVSVDSIAGTLNGNNTILGNIPISRYGGVISWSAFFHILLLYYYYYKAKACLIKTSQKFFHAKM